MKRKLLLEKLLLRRLLLLSLFAVSVFAGCGKDGGVDTVIPPTTQEPGDDLTGVAKQLAEAKWDVKEVSDAVVWKYFHFNNLFSSNQSITVFEIDLNKEIEVDIPYVKSGFLKTSEAANNTRATVAINGSYFNTSTGGSTVFFRKDGEIIKTTNSGFNPYREEAGFAIDNAGKISVVKRPAGGWPVVFTQTLLASGPLLVYGGEAVKQLDVVFNTARHPRTAVGVTKDNRLIAVVVDGRATQAHGMTTTELSEVMYALGCKEAMNLDGGGSSTAWVKNRGVVNYPTDNGKFDHEGERGVANAIVFVPKD